MWLKRNVTIRWPQTAQYLSNLRVGLHWNAYVNPSHPRAKKDPPNLLLVTEPVPDSWRTQGTAWQSIAEHMRTIIDDGQSVSQIACLWTEKGNPPNMWNTCRIHKWESTHTRSRKKRNYYLLYCLLLCNLVLNYLWTKHCRIQTHNE